MGAKVAMLGKRVGNLEIISESGTNKWGSFMYLCRCNCGKEKIISGGNLRSNHTISCGCIGKLRLKERRENSVDDLTGQKFTRLTVLHRIKDGLKNTRWKCICDCGNITTTVSGNLKRGVHKSCGCGLRGKTSFKYKEKTSSGSGYIRILDKQHPRASKYSGRVLEHIVVMEKMLGRSLVKGEEVHHKNGVRSDNRPSNLELWVKSQPAGQRPEDLVVWAKEILRRYENGI